MKKYTDMIVRSAIAEVERNKYKLKENCHNINTYLPENAYDRGVDDGIQFVFEVLNDKRMDQ